MANMHSRPCNEIRDLITIIKKRINEYIISPSEIVNQAIPVNWIPVDKAYKMSINKLLIVQKEVHDLHAVNEKEKKKHTISRA